MRRLIDPSRIMNARVRGGAPPIDPGDLRPGLSPEELRAAIAESPCPAAVEFVDETIEEWWSWHDGAIPGRIVPYLAPDAFQLASIESLLRSQNPDNYGPMGAERYENLTQFFPISNDEMGARHWLARSERGDPWTIWWADSKADMMPPSREWDGPAVLFSDFLEALVAIDQPWATLPSYNYPWR